MRALTAVGIAMIVLGIAAMTVALIRGEAGFALLVIIPVVYGSGPWALLGGLLLFLGFAVTFLSFIPRTVQRIPEAYERAEYPREQAGTSDQERRSDFGGVVLIGPIPILFGSAKSLKGSKFLLALMIISAVLFVVLILGFLLR